MAPPVFFEPASAETFGAHMRNVGLVLLLTSGPIVRFVLGLASALWAVELVIEPNIFDRVNYRALQELGHAMSLDNLQAQTLLAELLMLHAIGVAWRFADRRPCRLCGLIVNGWGFALWTAIVLSIYLSLGSIAVPVVATETLLCIGAFISLMTNDVRVWRHITP